MSLPDWLFIGAYVKFDGILCKTIDVKEDNVQLLSVNTRRYYDIDPRDKVALAKITKLSK